MKELFPRLNDHVLRYMISLRLKKFARFIFQEDLTPKGNAGLEEIQARFSHFFSRVNKINVYAGGSTPEVAERLSTMFIRDVLN